MTLTDAEKAATTHKWLSQFEESPYKILEAHKIRLFYPMLAKLNSLHRYMLQQNKPIVAEKLAEIIKEAENVDL